MAAYIHPATRTTCYSLQHTGAYFLSNSVVKRQKSIIISTVTLAAHARGGLIQQPPQQQQPLKLQQQTQQQQQLIPHSLPQMLPSVEAPYTVPADFPLTTRAH